MYSTEYGEYMPSANVYQSAVNILYAEWPCIPEFSEHMLSAHV